MSPIAATGRLRIRVIPVENGMTLRNFLVRRLRDTDKETALTLIKAGGVYINQLRVRLPTVRVAAGERVTVYPGAATAEALDPEGLVIVREDPHFLIVDKASGVPVAPTRECAVGSISEALIALLEARGVKRPYVGVVHRLDQGASGLVIFTTRSVANKSLHQQFVDHRIARHYRLAVEGEPGPRFECRAPLKITRSQTVQVVDDKTGDAVSAHTKFTLLRQKTEGRPALLEAELETGRTHQIRAHAAHLGHPIIGDRRYGADSTGAGTGWDRPELLHLHAHSLRFDHPITGEPVHVVSKLPSWANVD